MNPFRSKSVDRPPMAAETAGCALYLLPPQTVSYTMTAPVASGLWDGVTAVTE